MKDAKYFTCLINPQNVYVTYTGGDSRVICELFCVGLSPENATKIANRLNPISIKTLGEYSDEELAEIRQG
jgi:hypothetical protein